MKKLRKSYLKIEYKQRIRIDKTANEMQKHI